MYLDFNKMGFVKFFGVICLPFGTNGPASPCKRENKKTTGHNISYNDCS